MSEKSSSPRLTSDLTVRQLRYHTTRCTILTKQHRLLHLKSSVFDIGRGGLLGAEMLIKQLYSCGFSRELRKNVQF